LRILELRFPHWMRRRKQGILEFLHYDWKKHLHYSLNCGIN